MRAGWKDARASGDGEMVFYLRVGLHPSSLPSPSNLSDLPCGKNIMNVSQYSVEHNTFQGNLVLMSTGAPESHSPHAAKLLNNQGLCVPLGVHPATVVHQLNVPRQCQVVQL